MFGATVFNVMIASPDDVPDERQIVREVILGWNAINADTNEIVLLPVGWETHSYPEMGGNPQTILNQQVLDSCDLVVAIFGSRIGTPTIGFLSGTVEEIETHLKAGEPAMLYFSSGPVPRENLDSEQYRQLEEFRESCKRRGLYKTFDSPDDFRQKFSYQLNLMITKNKYFSQRASFGFSEEASKLRVNATEAQRASLELSNEAKKLLKEATKDPNGHILCYRADQGTIFITNNQEFGSESPRVQAAWENGFEELERHQLIKSQSSKRIEFKLTVQGYNLADRID